MTTPTGQISLSDIALEIYGSTTHQIDMQDPNVYYLAGITQGAQISMSDLQGKNYVRYTPASGTISNEGIYPASASVTITCSKSAVWTYSVITASPGTSVNVASGSSATSITFTLAASSSAARTASWSLSGVAFGITGTFTIDLDTTSLQ